jgi:Leucine-rich repeat (LRR) protein
MQRDHIFPLMQVENTSLDYTHLLQSPPHTPILKSTCDRLFAFTHISFKNFLIESINPDAAFLLKRLERVSIRPARNRNTDMIKSMLEQFTRVAPGLTCIEFDLGGQFELPDLHALAEFPIRSVQFRFLKLEPNLIDQLAGFRSHSQHLASITHNGFFLNAVSPALFDHFPNLEHLNLNFNKIVHIEPDVFTNASRLVELNLSENKIKQLNVDSLVGLVNLRVLKLECAQIEPGAFGRLVNLTRLDLSKSGPLSRVDARLFHGLGEHLLELKMNQCAIEAIESIDELVNLETLDLSSNRLIRLDLLKCRLKVANLSHNELVKVSLLQAEEIDLSSNRLACLDDLEVSEASVTRRLDLSGNQLRQLSSNGLITRMKALKELILSDNLVNEVSVDVFEGESSRLQVLKMSVMTCKCLHTGQFRSLSGLESLEIRCSETRATKTDNKGTFLYYFF